MFNVFCNYIFQFFAYHKLYPFHNHLLPDNYTPIQDTDPKDSMSILEQFFEALPGLTVLFIESIPIEVIPGLKVQLPIPAHTELAGLKVPPIEAILIEVPSPKQPVQHIQSIPIEVIPGHSVHLASSALFENRAFRGNSLPAREAITIEAIPIPIEAILIEAVPIEAIPI
jgi:hypothetical protein